MLDIQHCGTTLCDKLTRREWLSVGSLGAIGLSLPQFFSALATAAPSLTAAGKSDSPKAKACIQCFLWGGPGAQETWDLKPDAPDATRGEFTPISTSLPGVQFCEHLPLMSARAHKYTIIRSQTHTGINHGTSAYHMLTGHLHWAPGTLRHPTKQDMPQIGANAGRFLAHPAYLPAHVHMPSIVNDGDGLPVPGQGAGILGEKFEPFQVVGDLTKKDFQVPALSLAEGLSRDRLGKRVGLQRLIGEQVERHLASTDSGRAVDSSYQKAFGLLQSAKTDEAFDLGREPDALRARYGFHHFAQALLLARRLVEAGVPFVTVYWNAPSNTDNQSWDTHNNQHVRMRDYLLPAFDKAMSAFLDDMDERGLLDETLVTWWGEFGRTPKINANVGRDHWGFCQSVGLAGAGVKRGMVYGSSTPDGGYPATCPVTPDDLSATIFERLGIDCTRHMHDIQGRPVQLSFGQPVLAILD